MSARVFIRLAMADTHEEAIDAAHRHGAITPPRLHDCSGGAGVVGVIEITAPVAAPLASGEQPAAGALFDDGPSHCTCAYPAPPCAYCRAVAAIDGGTESVLHLATRVERWAAGLLASLEVGS